MIEPDADMLLAGAFVAAVNIVLWGAVLWLVAVRSMRWFKRSFLHGDRDAR